MASEPRLESEVLSLVPGEAGVQAGDGCRLQPATCPRLLGVGEGGLHVHTPWKGASMTPLRACSCTSRV